MGPVGGWIKFHNEAVSGRPCGIHQYRDGEDRRLAIGTHTKLYAYKPDNTLADITPSGYTTGRADRGNTFGYGIGFYSAALYGLSTPSTGSILSPTYWTLDNYGGILVACASTDGRLYTWDGITATATLIAGAPTGNNAVVVTEERFVVALGAANNNSLVQWSDQEDFTTWTPAATNQAGDFPLQTSGSILAGLRVRGQTLILTTTDAHTMTYVGAPLVYGFERVGTGCGLIGGLAGVATDSFAVWMSDNGFYLFDGFVKPLPSDVFDAVFSDFNKAQKEKVAAWNNGIVGEVWWHYPSGSSTECDSYVTWNYRENTWAMGKMTRNVGVSETVYDRPLLMGGDGFIYSHEIGFSYDGMTPFAETGPIELGNGDQHYMARFMYPDERTQGQVTATFRTRFYPNGPEYSAGPYTMTAPTPVRFTGRQVVMRVDAAVGADWRIGIPRLDVATGGTR